MAQDDWYRNETWNAGIAEAFQAKLGRAQHQKAQYLRIQASYLSEKYPDAALGLLDQYFALDDEFEQAQAWHARAKASTTLGDIEGAADAYVQALTREAVFPAALTQAYLDYPNLIALHRLEHRYAHALEVLETHRDRCMFPVDHFWWNAAKALILDDLGRSAEAVGPTTQALSYVDAEHSGFRYHRLLGLVSKTKRRSETYRRLVKLSQHR